MENSIKRKVNRIGLVGQIVSIILIVSMALSCLTCIVFGVVLTCMPEDSLAIHLSADIDTTIGKTIFGKHFDEIAKSISQEQANNQGFGARIDVTENELIIHEESEPIVFRLTKIAPALFVKMLYFALLLVVCIFLKRLSDKFRQCDTPFDNDVIHRMTIFAWVLLGGSILSHIALMASDILLVNALDFMSEVSLNINYSISMQEFSAGLPLVIIALIVLFLTMIFRYGAQLQKQSDETL